MKFIVPKDQRGIGQVVIIAIALIVVASIAVVGYMVSNKDDNKSSASNSQTDTNLVDECKKHYDDEDLCKAMANASAENVSQKSTIKSTGADGECTMVVSTDGQGNSQTSTSGTCLIGEYIVIGNTSYMKDTTDGKWFKMTSEAPVDNTSLTESFKFDPAQQKAEETVTYKKLGKEKCGNLNCFKYQLTDSKDAKLEQFIWFDDKDYRMQRLTMKDGTSSTDLSFEYVDVTITAPKETKEYSL